MEYKKILDAIFNSYRLNPFGTHGVAHWARVMETGLRLAEKTGADREVVMLFALFHDSKRRNEGIDFNHGLRGAKFAKALRGNIFDLADDKFELLFKACEHHTKGFTSGDATVITCWDADRLDLGRVGRTPDPERLCTDAAKDPEMIKWAHKRASVKLVPEIVFTEWGLGKLRFNDNNLPWLDARTLNIIFERVFDGYLEIENHHTRVEDKRLRDFIGLLKSMQHYNYLYRKDAYNELKSVLMSILPTFENSDKLRMHLALGLAIKELYGLRDVTLKRVFQNTTVFQDNRQ